MKTRLPIMCGAIALLTILATTLTGGAEDSKSPKKRITAENVKTNWFYPNVVQAPAVGYHDNVATTVIYTADPFPKVWQFYADKAGFDKKYSKTELFKTGRKADGAVYFINDIAKPHNRPEWDRAHSFFACTTAEFSVSVVVEEISGHDKMKTRAFVTALVP